MNDLKNKRTTLTSTPHQPSISIISLNEAVVTNVQSALANWYGKSYDIHVYDTFKHYQEDIQEESVIIVDLAGFSADQTYQLDLSKTVFVTNSQELAANHKGIEVHLLSNQAEVLHERLQLMLVNSTTSNTSIINQGCFVVKLGRFYYWIFEQDISDFIEREEVIFLVKKDGTEWPLNLSNRKIMQQILSIKKGEDDPATQTMMSLNDMHIHSGYAKQIFTNLIQNPQQHKVLFLIGLIILFLGAYGCCFGQSDPILDRAIQLSQNGAYAEAEVEFEQVQAPTEGNLNHLLMARAYNYSWWGRYEEAENLFNQILQQNDNHEDATVGLAYNYTWSKRYAQAVHVYNKAILLNPKNRSAYFGQVYNYLDAGNYDGAEYVSSLINDLFPEDPEGYYVQGLVEVHQLKPKAARKSFNKTLVLDPSFTSAKEQLNAIGTKPTRWALSVWYGLTENLDTYRHGFRRADLKYQLNDNTTIYSYYDNSLLLDNSFIGQDKLASLFAVGIKHGWTDKLFSKFEMGNRIFRDSKNQLLVNLENGYFFSPAVLGKLIVQYDLRGDESYGTISGGLDVEIFPKTRIEAMVYYTQNMQIPEINNRRVVIGPKILLNHVELVTGMYLDRIHDREFSASQVSGFYALSRISLTPRFEGHLLYNYDKGFFQNSATVYSLGVTYKI